ncbi:hypothetical protein [Variovorax sp. YR752]|uniref:hypothetical protein n=1 Tax=Variovorax sp. YR752 TaxID=1884383 RepID=UPI003137D366
MNSLRPLLHQGPPSTDRRRLLLGGLGLATTALAGCGGGGGGNGGPSVPSPGGGGSPGAPTGRLVYRNSGVAAVFDLRSGSELQFDPGTEPFVDPGLSVSRAGLISAAREGVANRSFEIAFFSLAGGLQSLYSVERELSFQTSCAVFNARSTRIAFSVDEPLSPSNGARAARTLVFDWPSGAPVAQIDGLEAPVWAGPADDLLLRDPQSGRVRLFSAALVDQGFVPGLVVSPLTGGWSASPDGRYVLTEDGNHVVVFDRSDGGTWVAAEDGTSSTHSPTLSPDGRHLAILARDLLGPSPHVMPFERGLKVTVDSERHALPVGLADCAGRIGWAA